VVTANRDEGRQVLLVSRHGYWDRVSRRHILWCGVGARLNVCGVCVCLSSECTCSGEGNGNMGVAVAAEWGPVWE